MTNNIDLTYFAGHESFYLREGWLKKSIDVVMEYPYIFQAKHLKEAINRLGVGANMVKSMRYWLDLCGLIEKNTTEGTYYLTDIATMIRKYDPYFQSRSALWVLHTIVTKKAPLWQIIFVENDFPVFDRELIYGLIDSRLKELGKKFAKKTVLDSIAVFLRTYLEEKNIIDPEDNIISPFSKLKLLNHYERRYSFRAIAGKEFSPYLICYLYFSNKRSEQILIDDIYNDFKHIINVDFNSVRKYIDYIENKKLIHIDRSAGLNNITVKKQMDMESIFKKMLEEESL